MGSQLACLILGIGNAHEIPSWGPHAGACSFYFYFIWKFSPLNLSLNWNPLSFVRTCIGLFYHVFYRMAPEVMQQLHGYDFKWVDLCHLLRNFCVFSHFYSFEYKQSRHLVIWHNCVGTRTWPCSIFKVSSYEGIPLNRVNYTCSSSLHSYQSLYWR